MRISDWSSDVCSSDLTGFDRPGQDFAEPFEMTPEQIETAFGDALAAQPAAPDVFLLYFRSDSIELTPESAAELPNIISTVAARPAADVSIVGDRKSTRLNSSH